MKRLLSWSGICLLLLQLVACQQENVPPAQQSAPPPQVERVKQSAPNPKVNRSPQAIAERLVRLATKIPQVKGASAISVGPYTLVGINVDPTLDSGRVGTVKYAVAEALREDPQGSRALVTADPDIVQRIRELNEDVRSGRPIAGILKELGEIVGRIMPQPTKETKPREPAPSKTDRERYQQSPHSK
jgi:YhcN/YlaJ family sporulation lipoprotein